ncbi:TPA: hypothetical protein SL602_005399 [Pseudomonas aeruginosa]|uniref:hypothetical protein n=1 Tax=Pseudomonas aeruginosa TaxID=287 RepID=UPI0029DB9586|nr:hypothetical protein [Pseudomonas aeruginosa]HEJ5276744.1 hypothetical protein [Pseudomonas aeruginosa]
MSTAEEFIAQDFVYAGRRLLKSGKMGGEVFVVIGGALGERMLFDYRTLKGKVVGGIYRGASFSADQVRDLSKASYQGQWADDLARMDWRVRDEAAESEQRTDKLEADAKRTHEIEELLLPLRKLYASYSQRNDYGGKEALEAAVLRALRRRPPKTA